MADTQHLALLKQGISGWNQWRQDNPDIEPDLQEADLKGADLSDANLSFANLVGAQLHQAILCRANIREAQLFNADLREADLNGADLTWADLTGANLSRAKFHQGKLQEAHLREADLRWIELHQSDLAGADLAEADLRGADLREAHLDGAHLHDAHLDGIKLNGAKIRHAKLNRVSLTRADLLEADLSGSDLSEANLSYSQLSAANLSEANLSRANLMSTNLDRATLHNTTLVLALLIEASLIQAQLSDCYVYGVSTWNLQLRNTTQHNLIISGRGEPFISVDHLEVAQFLHLVLHNEKLHEVIDTITSKVVLILGRFTPERKIVLDALREALRTKYNYVPVIFDFEAPGSRDFTETVVTLARLSRFIIADLTDPGSIQQEIQAITPDLAVPIQPLLKKGKRPYSMFQDFGWKHPWVLVLRSSRGDRIEKEVSQGREER